MNPTPSLAAFAPSRDFFVGIDSDGCVFDSMELKHKECFCPAFIDRFDLQAASRYAREVWEFVNLYSQTRGVNRFQAVLRALDLCRSRAEIVEREVSVPRLPALEQWVQSERKLGNPQLESRVAAEPHPDLERALAWSSQVNEAVAQIARNVPPLPSVRKVLKTLQPHADVVVVSQTPAEALYREWAEQELEGYVALIAGQELGTKTDHLRATAGAGSRHADAGGTAGPAAGHAGAVGTAGSGHENGGATPSAGPGDETAGTAATTAATPYPAGHVLMIGDAPGDRAAARETGALFYPILPGREEESWQRLREEGLDQFFAERYAGDYERALLDEFDSVLPAEPPWRKE